MWIDRRCAVEAAAVPAADGTLIYAFILLPILVVLVASVSTTNYLTFPPQGFTLRWFAGLTQLDNYIDALRYSLVVAVAATAIALVLGTWVALVIARFALSRPEPR